MLCTIHYASVILALLGCIYVIAFAWEQPWIARGALLALLAYVLTASEPVGCL